MTAARQPGPSDGSWACLVLAELGRHWGRATRHQAANRLPPSCPTDVAQTAPSLSCGSSVCLHFLLPTMHGWVTAAGSPQILGAVTSCFSLAAHTRLWAGCWRDVVETKRGRQQGKGLVAVPPCHQFCAICAHPAGTAAALQRCPGWGCPLVLLLPVSPSCSAVPGLALPPNPPQVSALVGQGVMG